MSSSNINNKDLPVEGGSVKRLRDAYEARINGQPAATVKGKRYYYARPADFEKPKNHYHCVQEVANAVREANSQPVVENQSKPEQPVVLYPKGIKDPNNHRFFVYPHCFFAYPPLGSDQQPAARVAKEVHSLARKVPPKLDLTLVAQQKSKHSSSATTESPDSPSSASESDISVSTPTSTNSTPTSKSSTPRSKTKKHSSSSSSTPSSKKEMRQAYDDLDLKDYLAKALAKKTPKEAPQTKDFPKLEALYPDISESLIGVEDDIAVQHEEVEFDREAYVVEQALIKNDRSLLAAAILYLDPSLLRRELEEHVPKTKTLDFLSALFADVNTPKNANVIVKEAVNEFIIQFFADFIKNDFLLKGHEVATYFGPKLKDNTKSILTLLFGSMVRAKKDLLGMNPPDMSRKEWMKAFVNYVKQSLPKQTERKWLKLILRDQYVELSKTSIDCSLVFNKYIITDRFDIFKIVHALAKNHFKLRNKISKNITNPYFEQVDKKCLKLQEDAERVALFISQYSFPGLIACPKELTSKLEVLNKGILNNYDPIRCAQLYSTIVEVMEDHRIESPLVSKFREDTMIEEFLNFKKFPMTCPAKYKGLKGTDGLKQYLEGIKDKAWAKLIACKWEEQENLKKNDVEEALMEIDYAPHDYAPHGIVWEYDREPDPSKNDAGGKIAVIRKEISELALEISALEKKDPIKNKQKIEELKVEMESKLAKQRLVRDEMMFLLEAALGVLSRFLDS